MDKKCPRQHVGTGYIVDTREVKMSNNNEINIKINVSDDMLSAIANILLLSNAPMLHKAMAIPKPTAPLPPSSPIGFRAKGGD